MKNHYEGLTVALCLEEIMLLAWHEDLEDTNLQKY